MAKLLCQRFPSPAERREGKLRGGGAKHLGTTTDPGFLETQVPWLRGVSQATRHPLYYGRHWLRPAAREQTVGRSTGAGVTCSVPQTQTSVGLGPP